jgi:hypothetical protein
VFTVRHGVWAAEASQQLRSEILTARLAFSLGEEFRLEVSEGEIRIQGIGLRDRPFSV